MAHWTTQATKEKGRFLGDVGADETGTPLNADEVKLRFDEVMGQIEHPTIVDICERILKAAEQWGWEEVIICKMDLKGAFTLLFIKPEDVRLLAFELTDIHHAAHMWFLWVHWTPGVFCGDFPSAGLCDSGDYNRFHSDLRG